MRRHVAYILYISIPILLEEYSIDTNCSVRDLALRAGCDWCEAYNHCGEDATYPFCCPQPSTVLRYIRDAHALAFSFVFALSMRYEIDFILSMSPLHISRLIRFSFLSQVCWLNHMPQAQAALTPKWSANVGQTWSSLEEPKDCWKLVDSWQLLYDGPHPQDFQDLNDI